MSKISVKAAARDALKADAKMRMQGPGTPLLSAATSDSFINFAHKLGIGADNALTGGSYGFNPITRNRNLLEWIHRGSWLGGVAVDLVADDMTRRGIEYISEMKPDDAEKLDHAATRFDVWNKVNETIKWGRLYGGALGVVLIDGQDLRQPLRLETVGPDQFKGILPLDRWMVEPTLEDLVTEMGPHLGLPKFYRVQPNAPALRGQAIHHSRVAFRLEGIKLPYQQRLTENLWGISVIERLYDRMVAFDTATTGAAQLVTKSYLRTLKVKDLRNIVASGGAPMAGLTAYVDMMRRYQGIEGMTMVDAEDEFDVQGHSAFSGLADALTQFGQQLSGALQIPLVRLFGQSPAGLNASGESDLRMFYDHIKQEQVKDLYHGMTLIYKLIAQSERVVIPENFALDFKSLWEMTETDKANIAKVTTDAVSSAKDTGLISDQVALRELRQSSRITGVFTNITQELIEQADDKVEDPVEVQKLQSLMTQGEDDATGPNGQAGKMATSPRRRVKLQQQAKGSSKAGSGAGSGDQS